jgi:hypothetical protein
MNWRALVGLLFLLAGMAKLYSLIANQAAGKLSGNPLYAEIGCTIWMGVGVFLIIQGLKKREH